jgi:hypothetical protein
MPRQGTELWDAEAHDDANSKEVDADVKGVDGAVKAPELAAKGVDGAFKAPELSPKGVDGASKAAELIAMTGHGAVKAAELGNGEAQVVMLGGHGFGMACGGVELLIMAPMRIAILDKHPGQVTWMRAESILSDGFILADLCYCA